MIFLLRIEDGFFTPVVVNKGRIKGIVGLGYFNTTD